MSLCVISFTKRGAELSRRVKTWQSSAELYTKWSGGQLEGIVYVKEGIHIWTGRQMEKKNGLLFIGACGIAVRAIAPYVTDKLCDSPVLVMDEMGQYIIPVLSGHMGGANELAGSLAHVLGAVPVITTATDINGRFAADLFAKKNQLAVMNREGIAAVSARILDGKEIMVRIDAGHLRETRLPDGVRIAEETVSESADIRITETAEAGECLLLLKPKRYVLGMGCRKGKTFAEMESFVKRILEEQGISEKEIAALASIDRKAEEPCFLEWSRKYGVPFVTFSAAELQAVCGTFRTSAFVKEQVGTDNVCERSALKACGESGQLAVLKQAEQGMTLAVAKRDWSITFDET